MMIEEKSAAQIAQEVTAHIERATIDLLIARRMLFDETLLRSYRSKAYGRGLKARQRLEGHKAHAERAAQAILGSAATEEERAAATALFEATEKAAWLLI